MLKTILFETTLPAVKLVAVELVVSKVIVPVTSLLCKPAVVVSAKVILEICDGSVTWVNALVKSLAEIPKPGKGSIVKLPVEGKLAVFCIVKPVDVQLLPPLKVTVTLPPDWGVVPLATVASIDNLPIPWTENSLTSKLPVKVPRLSAALVWVVSSPLM